MCSSSASWVSFVGIVTIANHLRSCFEGATMKEKDRSHCCWLRLSGSDSSCLEFGKLNVENAIRVIGLELLS